jgi:hypothetical protein
MPVNILPPNTTALLGTEVLTCDDAREVVRCMQDSMRCMMNNDSKCMADMEKRCKKYASILNPKIPDAAKPNPVEPQKAAEAVNRAAAAGIDIAQCSCAQAPPSGTVKFSEPLPVTVAKSTAPLAPSTKSTALQPAVSTTSAAATTPSTASTPLKTATTPSTAAPAVSRWARTPPGTLPGACMGFDIETRKWYPGEWDSKKNECAANVDGKRTIRSALDRTQFPAQPHAWSKSSAVKAQDSLDIEDIEFCRGVTSKGVTVYGNVQKGKCVTAGGESLAIYDLAGPIIK